MYAKRIANEMLGNCLSTLHVKLAESVKAAVDGVLSGGHLSLSQLARSVKSAVAVRHRVKRIDRLLGSAPLHAARVEIYRRVAARWLSGLDEVLVLIDGSDATTDQRWHLLRASIAVEGRSVTLYERNSSEKEIGEPGSPPPVSGLPGEAAARRLPADRHHRCGLSLNLVRFTLRAPLAMDRTHSWQRHGQH